MLSAQMAAQLPVPLTPLSCPDSPSSRTDITGLNRPLIIFNYNGKVSRIDSVFLVNHRGGKQTRNERKKTNEKRRKGGRGQGNGNPRFLWELSIALPSDSLHVPSLPFPPVTLPAQLFSLSHILFSSFSIIFLSIVHG